MDDSSLGIPESKPSQGTLARKQAGCARAVGLAQSGVALTSLALCLAIAILYCFRWPGAVAATIFPVWAWAAVGTGILALSHSRPSRRRTLAILGTWVLLVAIFAEEPRALLTCFRRWPDPQWLAAGGEGRAWRVVTVNCAGGQVEVAEEALAYEPDVVLLQESPSTPELERFVQRHQDYSLVRGFDASILARGTLGRLPAQHDDLGFLTMAEAVLGNQRIAIVDIRLLLPYCDIDLWQARAWRDARQAYDAREAQMKALARHIQQIDLNTPLIVGGDFNTPPGDSLFRKLRPRLRDSFPEGGIGLGNTIINDIPLSRIDQLWVSRHFRIHSVLVRRTEHSDHRLVICDVSLAP